MISVVIPHWPKTEELDKLLKVCVASLKADEIIVVVNEGIGFAKAVNIGLRLASGDYLCVVNNDTRVVKGELSNLVDPGAVTSPVMNRSARHFWGAFFCIPRWVYEKIGGLDEQFEIGYFEDDDFVERLRQAQIPFHSVHSVWIETKGEQTMKFTDKDKFLHQNAERFGKKWGKQPDKMPISILAEDGSVISTLQA